MEKEKVKTVYDFNVVDAEGNNVNMGKYKG
jgi:hypothetical protein